MLDVLFPTRWRKCNICISHDMKTKSFYVNDFYLVLMQKRLNYSWNTASHASYIYSYTTNIFQINTGSADEKYLKPILAALLVCCPPPLTTNKPIFSRRKCPHGCYRNLLEFWELKTTTVSKFCLHVFLCKYFPCHMPINFNKLDVLQFGLRCSWGKSDVDLKCTR